MDSDFKFLLFRIPSNIQYNTGDPTSPRTLPLLFFNKIYLCSGVGRPQGYFPNTTTPLALKQKGGIFPHTRTPLDLKPRGAIAVARVGFRINLDLRGAIAVAPSGFRFQILLYSRSLPLLNPTKVIPQVPVRFPLLLASERFPSSWGWTTTGILPQCRNRIDSDPRGGIAVAHFVFRKF